MRFLCRTLFRSLQRRTVLGCLLNVCVRKCPVARLAQGYVWSASTTVVASIDFKNTRMAGHGRVEPEWVSDSSAEPCRSKVLRDKIFERVGKVALWPDSGLNGSPRTGHR